ncbi:MAG: hypothetical protein HQK76_06385 [Desulfobacterales bacterium]|nr:hypothetical protein [Desulfobacterales bacterium]
MKRMFKYIIYLITFISISCFFCLTSSYADNNFDAILKQNKKVIENAQNYVSDVQLKRYLREVTFLKPIEMFPINKKYISISFDVKIGVRGTRGQEKNAVFALLFEKDASNNLKYVKDLRWTTDKDIENYKKIDVEQLAQYYVKAGIKDCIPEKKAVASTTTPKKTEPPPSDKIASHTHSGQDINSGKVSEEFIDDAITRDIEMSIELSTKEEIGHQHDDRYVPKEYADKLEDEIAKLKKTVDSMNGTIEKMNALLKGVTREGNEIIFSSMNVKIVNGSGSTEGEVNGTGNLIIGYNEKDKEANRKGSHNIVIGPKHNYSSYGGIVSGNNNSISGKYAIVIGGVNNNASGEFAIITGGNDHTASGKLSSINGGNNMKAEDQLTTISGNKTLLGKNPHFQ